MCYIPYKENTSILQPATNCISRDYQLANTKKPVNTKKRFNTNKGATRMDIIRCKKYMSETTVRRNEIKTRLPSASNLVFYIYV